MKVYWAPFIPPTPAIQEFDGLPNISSATWPEPEALSKHLPEIFIDTGVTRCPAFTDQNRNTFVLKSPTELTLVSDKETGFQCSFDARTKGPKVLLQRSKDKSLYSLRMHYLFIPEAPTKINIRSAAYSMNTFARETMLVGGEFDIGQFPRPIDCAFFIPPWIDYLHIKHDDPLFYATFKPHDESKVQLKKFTMTSEIYNVIRGNVQAKTSKNDDTIWRLLDYYKMYKNSKQHGYLINKIKENLLD